MNAKGIDLEITDNSVRINGIEVLTADEDIVISPVGRKHYLTATITLFVKKLTVEDSKLEPQASMYGSSETLVL